MTLRIFKRPKEESLIDGCRRGDNKAQRQLYEQYSPKMLSICRRYVSDLAEAEGVMVNGFLKVFEKIGQFTGEGNFEGWIRRIMVNEALMYIRSNRRASMMVDVDEAHAKECSEDAFSTLAAEDLLRLVESLPDGYRAVFNMYAIEGYSHREISEQLGITENTSKSQLSRARAMLKKQVTRLMDVQFQAV
jgi:RNA polymerase sigma-70 factor (ECF subfamily)